jgi:GT2 family glycosyltransferase
VRVVTLFSLNDMMAVGSKVSTLESACNEIAHAQADKLSIIIPTYKREAVLIETINHLLRLRPEPAEVLLIDQTPRHEETTERGLRELERGGVVRQVKLNRPSITGAMNEGLRQARCEVVLFLDDDIIPDSELLAAHLAAHARGERIVAGQVLQPGESPLDDEKKSEEFRFASNCRQYITEVMGGNFSIRRELALELGGFDENFVHVAYKFEAEFAHRALAEGKLILFEPTASIRHLKAISGGTRSFGHHLKTIRPSHTVGAYYFLLRSESKPSRLMNLLSRPFSAVRTRHHATHPWWIPATLVSEVMGFIWALSLYLRGPRLINHTHGAVSNYD